MSKNETVYLGAGCFWCVENIFSQIKGVEEVISGYMGGKKEEAQYQIVCKGNTRHAEVIKVVFNTNIVSFSNILEIFFYVHDPTSLNRQGNDVGPQYRSVIFYSSQNQLKVIRKIISKIKNKYEKGVVTEVTKALEFYKAEDYHVNYYNLNKNQPYCKIVISPKISSFQIRFKEFLKN